MTIGNISDPLSSLFLSWLCKHNIMLNILSLFYILGSLILVDLEKQVCDHICRASKNICKDKQPVKFEVYLTDALLPTCTRVYMHFDF